LFNQRYACGFCISRSCKRQRGICFVLNGKLKMGGQMYMFMLKKVTVNLLVAFIVVVLSCGLAQATTVTIATFADPAADGSTPLFTVDLAGDLITGGWDDSKTGLLLEIPYLGHTYTDAFFTITDVNYFGGLAGGDTEGGTIKFFADGQSTSTTPLIQIDFGSGHVSPSSFGAMFYLDSVTISGLELGSLILTDGSFAFGLGNQAPSSGGWTSGFTATAAFTSSATIPEPATIALLGTASICIFTRKKRSA
jgi:hypothetical protein